MESLEYEIVHCVKECMRHFPVLHAPWVVMIEKVNDYHLKVIGMLPENTTLPHGLKKPVHPISFNHRQMDKPMDTISNVHFYPIAREFCKEISKAYKLGDQYGKNVIVEG